jgi:hypothetical protein
MNKFAVSRERHAVWAKIPCIQEAMATFPHAEWVWWLDVDAIVMAPQVKLWEDILRKEALRGKMLRVVELVLNERVVPGKDQSDRFRIETEEVPQPAQIE